MGTYELRVFDSFGYEAAWLRRDVASVEQGNADGERDVRGLDGWSYQVVFVPFAPEGRADA